MFSRFVFVVVCLVLVAQPVHAEPQSAFSVMVFDRVSGEPVAGMSVIGAPDDDALALVALQTDSDGMADFGQLSPGNWRFSTCGQTVVYGSADGDTAATWLVACSRLWLPVVGRWGAEG